MRIIQPIRLDADAMRIVSYWKRKYRTEDFSEMIRALYTEIAAEDAKTARHEK